MTDDQMDARLRAAGLAFRTDTDGPAIDAADAVATTRDPIELATVTPARRRRPAALLISAAVVVAALVVGGALALRGFGGGSGRGATGPTPESQLVGRTWTLYSIGTRQNSSGTERSVTHALQLTFGRDGTYAVNGCDKQSGSASVDDTRIVFRRRQGEVCSYPAGYDASDDDALSRVVTGTVTFSITQGQLVLVKGHDVLTFDGPDVDRAPSPEPTGSSGLFGAWSLTGVEHDTANSSSGASASGSTITFDENSYTLVQACGSYSGAWHLDGQHAVLTAPRFTGDHSCPAQAGRQQVDETVRGVLHGSVAYSINDGQLTLTQGATSLTFEPQAPDTPSTSQTTDPTTSGVDPASTPPRLIGTSWVLSSVMTGSNGIVLSSAGVGIRLLITPAGTVTVGTCSALRGSAAVGTGTITFLDVRPTTPGSCTGGAGSDNVTSAVTDVVGGRVSWTIAGRRLTLTRGGTSLVFVAV